LNAVLLIIPALKYKACNRKAARNDENKLDKPRLTIE